MQTIALANQKGGVGKTVLATNLAVTAAAAGLRTMIIDLDPQRSCVEWAGRRDARTERLGVAGLDQVARLPGVLAELAGDYDLAILDCPGSFDTAGRIAMQQVDLALIPSRPAVLDITATKATVRALSALGKPFAFVLNQCPTQPGNPRAKNAAMGLRMIGALAEPPILQRADYQDAIAVGQSVAEYDPASKAAGEIRSLFAWVQSRLEQKAAA